MKKWLLIYLIFNLLAVNLPKDYVISICKLGNLFVHYYHHAHEKHEHNILDFLADHYAGHKHHQADHEDHENLPFHHHHHQEDFSQFAAQPIFVLPQSMEKLAFFPINSVIKALNFSAPKWYAHQITGDIWQPPKA